MEISLCNRLPFFRHSLHNHQPTENLLCNRLPLFRHLLHNHQLSGESIQDLGCLASEGPASIDHLTADQLCLIAGVGF